MTELYLVRHGQTEENAAQILQGHMPGHLSREGIAQAQALRDELKDIRFDALLCSDLKRCMDTAMILNEPHGLLLESTPLLRERDWGPFTGMDILKARTKIDHRAEPVESMFRRAETFLLNIVSRYKDKRVLVVSHGLFCRVIQAACLGKTIRDIPRMDNAEVRRLILTPPFSFSCLQEETGATAN
ncbi:phosphoglycerate mutase family protein [Paraprevotella xylaniphila YIT 11841]|uniref:Phosphoglycerate mutase family protein n=1 Tax=Paraprevotella xylaniphila YIT 11841 TaxID=762982 RepID=F3QSH6_9BACT|nr:histidine phosphatase family protein [Paraprevotella xylaniphila]EGG55263.1 phosphoglycerate mutase family protein [Paraprevotella xylaniphila YIT 11841]